MYVTSQKRPFGLVLTNQPNNRPLFTGSTIIDGFSKLSNDPKTVGFSSYPSRYYFDAPLINVEPACKDVSDCDCFVMSHMYFEIHSPFQVNVVASKRPTLQDTARNSLSCRSTPFSSDIALNPEMETFLKIITSCSQSNTFSSPYFLHIMCSSDDTVIS